MRRVAITLSRVACAQSRLLEVRMQLFAAPTPVGGRLLPMAVALVAAGGAIGATVRWLVATLMEAEPATWPWSTLCVNVVGCVMIGVAARYIDAARNNGTSSLRACSEDSRRCHRSPLS